MTRRSFPGSLDANPIESGKKIHSRARPIPSRMGSSVGRSVQWTVSLLARLVFVAAVVALVAGLAVGSADLPVGTGGVDGIVGDALGASGSEDIESVPASNGAGLNGTRLEYLIHNYTNRERAQHNRSNLTFDADLRPVTRYHSADMANRSYFSHVGPQGETLADRYDRFGYRCRVWTGGFSVATGGENILMTYYRSPVATEDGTERYSTPRELARAIVNGWMNSTDHRRNLLKPYWDREAIGIHIETTNGRTRVYATQNFC